MVSLALLSGLRRGELFALRWRDFDEQNECLIVREAVYEGAFSTPKTAAGVRQIPLSAATVQLVAEWRRRVKHTEPESLVFSTWSGKPISPNSVSRRWIYPACETLGLKRLLCLRHRVSTLGLWPREENKICYRSTGISHRKVGSPHWAISATGSSVRLPDAAVAKRKSASRPCSVSLSNTAQARRHRTRILNKRRHFQDIVGGLNQARLPSHADRS